MSTTYELFLRWMSAEGHPSGREAAKALKVSPMGPTNWKNGHNAEPHIVERMAVDLGENPDVYLVRVLKETAKGPNVKTIERLAKRLGIAACILLSAGVPLPSQAVVTPSEPGNSASLYIM